VILKANVLLSYLSLTLLVGWQEGHLAYENLEWWDTGMVIYLEWGASDLHMVKLMLLPPHHLLLQQNPEWFTFLGPIYPGCPGKRAVKWV